MRLELPQPQQGLSQWLPGEADVDIFGFFGTDRSTVAVRFLPPTPMIPWWRAMLWGPVR